jgi:hypothetical protein
MKVQNTCPYCEETFRDVGCVVKHMKCAHKRWFV